MTYRYITTKNYMTNDIKFSHIMTTLICTPVFPCLLMSYLSLIFTSPVVSFTTSLLFIFSSKLNYITWLSSLGVKAPSTLCKDNYTLWCAIGCRTLLILFIDCMCITRHCQITVLCMALEIHSVHMYVYICIFIHSPRPSVLWDNN